MTEAGLQPVRLRTAERGARFARLRGDHRLWRHDHEEVYLGCGLPCLVCRRGEGGLARGGAIEGYQHAHD